MIPDAVSLSNLREARQPNYVRLVDQSPSMVTRWRWPQTTHQVDAGPSR
ncbi:MAG: hypothetical protein Ct9H300mP11_21360 [Chloroflexota bacterium]|nr:MAG: hypothetical protein Ct9H300mP11_21360 [Chloroflexota bacterium]